MLRTNYQRAVATYWNTNQRDPVNLRLGEIDGLYHHHYGIGEYDPSVLAGPEDTRDDRIIAEMHRLETAQADVLLDHLGAIEPTARLLDAGSGRGGTSFMAHRRFGARVDGVSISEYQVGFATEQAAERGVAEEVRFHFRNMLDTGFDTGSTRGIWNNESTMYVDLFALYAEFARLLEYGGRYVCITGCSNDVTGLQSKAVSRIDEHYTCNITPTQRILQSPRREQPHPDQRRRSHRENHPLLGAARAVLSRNRNRTSLPHRVPRGQLPLPAHRSGSNLTWNKLSSSTRPGWPSTSPTKQPCTTRPPRFTWHSPSTYSTRPGNYSSPDGPQANKPGPTYGPTAAVATPNPGSHYPKRSADDYTTS